MPAAARGQDSATKVGNKLKDFFKKEKGHRVPMEEDHLRQGRDENGVYWEIDRDGCLVAGEQWVHGGDGARAGGRLVFILIL